MISPNLVLSLDGKTIHRIYSIPYRGNKQINVHVRRSPNTIIVSSPDLSGIPPGYIDTTKYPPNQTLEEKMETAAMNFVAIIKDTYSSDR